MQHRVPALRICFLGAFAWSTITLWSNWVSIIPIVFSLYGLLLLSPLADHLENKER